MPVLVTDVPMSLASAKQYQKAGIPTCFLDPAIKRAARVGKLYVHRHLVPVGDTVACAQLAAELKAAKMSLSRARDKRSHGGAVIANPESGIMASGKLTLGGVPSTVPCTCMGGFWRSKRAERYLAAAEVGYEIPADMLAPLPPRGGTLRATDVPDTLVVKLAAAEAKATTPKQRRSAPAASRKASPVKVTIDPTLVKAARKREKEAARRAVKALAAADAAARIDVGAMIDATRESAVA